MNIEEIEEFTEFLENMIRKYRDEGIEISPWLSGSIANQIREKYSVQKRGYQGKYLLVEEDQAVPCCKGCSNEMGSCGTSCVGCEKMKAWRLEWTWELYAPKKFSVYKKLRET